MKRVTQINILNEKKNVSQLATDSHEPEGFVYGRDNKELDIYKF